jgi:hypothetical protein
MVLGLDQVHDIVGPSNEEIRLARSGGSRVTFDGEVLLPK